MRLPTNTSHVILATDGRSQLGSNARRVLAALLGSTLLVASSLASAPLAAVGARTSFTATTEGSPQATVSGEWESSGRTAKLTFAGGHPAPVGKTKFTATWVSPFTKPTTRPKLRIPATYLTAYPQDEAVEIFVELRVRTQGEAWRPWFWYPMLISKTGIGTFQDKASSFGLRSRQPQRWQVEWKLTGILRSAAVLRGTHELSFR